MVPALPVFLACRPRPTVRLVQPGQLSRRMQKAGRLRAVSPPNESCGELSASCSSSLFLVFARCWLTPAFCLTLRCETLSLHSATVYSNMSCKEFGLILKSRKLLMAQQHIVGKLGTARNV